MSGSPLRRNTPSLWNLAWSKQYFWDGRAPSLEEQVRDADRDRRRDGRRLADNSARGSQADADLAAQFRAAFPEEPAVSQATIVKALAAYVRSLVSPPTRFDAWIDGDAQALSAAEVRGFRLFTGKAGCVLCHVGWRFTDDRFHDIGLPQRAIRAAVPCRAARRACRPSRRPSLRDVAHTAPYMHDGSLPTLTAVLRHYTGGFVARPTLAASMNRQLRLIASGEVRPDRLPAHAVDVAGRNKARALRRRRAQAGRLPSMTASTRHDAAGHVSA